MSETSEPTRTATSAPPVEPDPGPPVVEASMRSVFPASTGCEVRPSGDGKVEVLLCRSSDHLVRYSRWTPGDGRFVYLDRENGASEPLAVEGRTVGRQWTSEEVGDPEPWQWSATYDTLPFSVSVESRTEAGRTRGVEAVRAALLPPSTFGG